VRVLIAGATGLLGTALSARLEADGDTVVPLRRGTASPGPRWDPAAGTIDPTALDGVDAVVNLAGESIAGGLWTAARRRRIRHSRVSGTTLLARAMAVPGCSARTLVNASAVGYYGDRGNESLPEAAPGGSGFLADVAAEWEAATQPAVAGGVRVVLSRFGVMLDPSGGMLGTLLPVFRCGGGAQLGDGQQWISWIALTDAVEVVVRALRDPALAGPVNAVSPNPVRNDTFTRLLGAAVRRPTFLRAPAWILRAALGEMATDLLLGSQRCIPTRLKAVGFTFALPELDNALQTMLSPSTHSSSPGSAHA
jgi:uncharacterized protein (TIGR01777 family)